MAVKRRNLKKREREELMEKAVKIKCCYCDLYNTCKHVKDKEKDELKGITYCTMTPNRPKNFVKKQNRSKKLWKP